MKNEKNTTGSTFIIVKRPILFVSSITSVVTDTLNQFQYNGGICHKLNGQVFL